MTIIKHFAFALAVTLCALLMSAQAQTPRINSINITAESDKVHVSAQGDVTEMRVEVADEAGDVIFESGAITGHTLDWNMQDAQGERVSAGTYLFTVTFRPATGKLRKRVEQVTISEEEKTGTETATSKPAGPQAVQAPIDGAGTAGKIAKFTDANTIADSVITESAAKIGIGVTAPISKLHVLSAANDNPPRLQSSGTTSFAAGWDFYHGSSPKGYVGVPNTGADVGPGEMLVYGSPGVKTSLWAGGARSMTIATNGSVGIGTTAPTAKLAVQTGNFSYGMTHTNGTITVGSYIDPTGGWLGTRSNHPLYFFTNGGLQQMTLATNGNVGIGTANPTAKLDVRATGGTPAVKAISQGNAVIGLSSTPNFAAIYGENTSGSSGSGVYGKGTSGYAVYADGNAGQTRDKGGFVKAMLFVLANGTISRCYNGLTGASLTGGTTNTGCGFTVTSAASGGLYRVNFGSGFQISDRFFSVTSSTSGVGGNIAARVFTSSFYANNEIGVTTFRTFEESGLVVSDFHLIVY